MTGVHWLLAHCSVLKVRAFRFRSPRLSTWFRRDEKAAGLATDDPNVPGFTGRLRQALSSPVAVVRKVTDTRKPLSRPLDREPSDSTPAYTGRQPALCAKPQVAAYNRTLATLAKCLRPVCHTEPTKASTGAVNRSR